MTRKIIFIIVGAVLFLLLLGLLWFWLLHRAPADTGSQASGFGTSTDKTGSLQAGGQGSSNTGTSLSPGSSGTNGVDLNGQPIINAGGINTSNSSGIGGGSSGSNGVNGGSISAGGTVITGGTGTSSTTPVSVAAPTVTGVQNPSWVGATVSERAFTPAEINQINSTAGLSGTPLISTTPQAAGLGTSGLILGAVAAGCAAQYAANQLIGTAATAADPTTLASVGTAVITIDLKAATQRNETKTQSIYQCLVKSIAQAAVDQITRSVVSWINSGFNGQPSFVQNFNQYFANVADQAAGEFIKGSALSFLCSPFAPQIKIAIAQSYANRNTAASCSLTKVINNINGFMGGSWGAGGWGGLLQFTTIPTNNPYGAYAYAQLSLNSSINSAQTNAKSNVSPGGFISLQKCDNTPAVNAGVGQIKPQQNCKVTTPGNVIEDSLKNSLNNPIQGLNLAQDINQIISALTNQVMVKTLYGGLGSSLGINNPLAPAIDQGASNQAQALLAQLQTLLGVAGQYASVEQGSIADIQNAQAGLNAAFNCWSTAASSTALTNDQQAQARQKAADADTAGAALDARIGAFNNEITRANAALGIIQNLQSQVLFAATPGDVQSAAGAITTAQAQGLLFGAADITTAQQNRTTLQTELAAQNQQTTASLTQCRALGNTTL